MISRDAVRHVFGTDVYGSDGDKIGSAGQVYLDNETGEPAWVSVRTGLFGRKESFVPLRDADLTGDRLQVPFGKEQVKNAPRIDQDGELGPDDEDKLYRYYESSPTASPSAEDDGHDDTGGRDTSRSATDDAMTRSEERLVVTGTRTERTGKARLRKYVVTEQRQVNVPVSHEEVRLEQEPDEGVTGSEEPTAEPEMTLWEERPVVTTEAVPVERVRLGKKTVTRPETIAGEVRKEQIELEEDSGPGPDRR